MAAQERGRVMKPPYRGYLDIQNQSHNEFGIYVQQAPVFCVGTESHPTQKPLNDLVYRLRALSRAGADFNFDRLEELHTFLGMIGTDVEELVAARALWRRFEIWRSSRESEMIENMNGIAERDGTELDYAAMRSEAEKVLSVVNLYRRHPGGRDA